MPLWTPPVRDVVMEARGFKLWNWDLLDAISTGSQSGVAAGVIHLDRLEVPVTTTFNTLTYHIGNTPAGLANCYVGVYDSSGARLGVSADQSSLWTGPGLCQTAIVSPFTVTGGSGVFVWCAYISGTASTVPNFARSTAVSVIGGSGGLNVSPLTGNSRVAADYGTGQTSLVTPLTLASLSDSTRNTFWAVS